MHVYNDQPAAGNPGVVEKNLEPGERLEDPEWPPDHIDEDLGIGEEGRRG